MAARPADELSLAHATMEVDTASNEALVEEFGADVADLVAGVTKIGKLQFRTKQEAQAENFRKMMCLKWQL